MLRSSIHPHFTASLLALAGIVFPVSEPEGPARAPAKTSPHVQPPAQPPTDPIELVLKPYAGSLCTVEGRIGEFRAPFLFDSGGGYTVLSLATAKSVGCTAFGRGTGFRHDGERTDGARGTPLEIALGAFTRSGEVGVLDLDKLLGGLPPLAGIVSLETFAGESLTIDLRGRRLIVESAKSLVERTHGLAPLEVRIARQAAGAALDVFVAIEGKHGPLWFELDCGNLAPVLVAPHAYAELGLEPPAAGKTKEASLVMRGLGPVACEIQTKELIYDGLFNAAFFERHVVTLDLATGRGWAKASQAISR